MKEKRWRWRLWRRGNPSASQSSYLHFHENFSRNLTQFFISFNLHFSPFPTCRLQHRKHYIQHWNLWASSKTHKSFGTPKTETTKKHSLDGRGGASLCERLFSVFPPFHFTVHIVCFVLALLITLCFFLRISVIFMSGRKAPCHWRKWKQGRGMAMRQYRMSYLWSKQRNHRHKKQKKHTHKKERARDDNPKNSLNDNE